MTLMNRLRKLPAGLLAVVLLSFLTLPLFAAPARHTRRHHAHYRYSPHHHMRRVPPPYTHTPHIPPPP